MTERVCFNGLANAVVLHLPGHFLNVLYQKYVLNNFGAFKMYSNILDTSPFPEFLSPAIVINLQEDSEVLIHLNRVIRL